MNKKRKAANLDFAPEVRIAFLLWLDKAGLDVTDKIVFRKAVQAAIKNCELTPIEIAEMVGYSKSMVSRWARGLSAPHESARAWIIEKLKDLIEERVRQDREAVE